MSPRTKKQLDAHRAARHNEILLIALRLFAAKGYFNTSINDIAKAAQISKGLLYSYFDNKEQLLNAAIQYALTEATRLNTEQDMGGSDPKEKFSKTIDTFFVMLTDKKELWSLIVSLAIHVGNIPSVHSIISDTYKGIGIKLKQVLEDLSVENPEEEALKLSALLDGIGIQYLIFGEEFPLDRIKGNIIKTYVE
ncbi:TetR/AcrR family transcriptional regulator [Winogradskyella sp.]|uniref:TetR/AcrR family transcriptional regulator n=1 Tax=Winogradskyella sp. TaxID=1883156 RepID=UPI003BAB036A